MKQTYQIPEYILNGSKKEEKNNDNTCKYFYVIVILFIIGLAGFLINFFDKLSLKPIIQTTINYFEIDDPIIELFFIYPIILAIAIYFLMLMFCVLNLIWLMILAVNIILCAVNIKKVSQGKKIFLIIAVAVSALVIIFGPVFNIVNIIKVLSHLRF